MSSGVARRRLSVDERRAQILAVAVGVARESGLSAVTLSEVRRRTGVSAGLTGHYFDSIDGLRVAAFRALFDSEAPAVADQPLARVRAMLGDFVSESAEGQARAWIDALQFARTSPQLREEVLRRTASDRIELQHAIEDGIRTGEFTCADPERSALRVLVVLDGYLMQFVLSEERGIRVELGRVVWDIAERELGLPEGALRE